MSKQHIIDATRHDKYLTVRMDHCHFDLSKELLEEAGMDMKEYMTEVEIKDIKCAPVCIIDLDKIILHKTEHCDPEIVKRLDSIYEICIYLGLTHIPWSNNYTIKEWLQIYPHLPPLN